MFTRFFTKRELLLILIAAVLMLGQIWLDITIPQYGCALYVDGTNSISTPDRYEENLNILWVDGHVTTMKTLDLKAGRPSDVAAANGKGYYFYAQRK